MTRQPGNTDSAQKAFIDMEGLIDSVEAWAETLSLLGLAPIQHSTAPSHVIGNALEIVARNLRCRWDAIHEAGGVGVGPGKPGARSDPDGDLQLRHDCAELFAIKDRSNSDDIADNDIALKALSDRDSHLCHEIVCSKALTARGLAAKARVVARECGLELALAGREPADLDDASRLIMSLLRDVLRGPASADWQRSNP